MPKGLSYYSTLNLQTVKMVHNENVYKEVSEELGIPVEVVKAAYRSVYCFIVDRIEELPFKRLIPEQEFNQLRTSFNLPSLGKFACPYKYYLKQYKLQNHIKELRDAKAKENQADVHFTCDNS